MKRREFLVSTAAFTGLALIPWEFNFSAFTTPKYAQAGFIGQCHNMLYEYNRIIKYGIRYTNGSSKDNYYLREIELLKAANNVTKQDIINEIKQKWNDDDASITTCAAEGDYGLDSGTFRMHMKIGRLKEFIKNMRETSYKSFLRNREPKTIKTGKHGYRRYNIRMENGNLIHQTYWYKTGKTTKHEILQYGIDTFAQEMISNRKQYDTPLWKEQRERNEEQIKNGYYTPNV